MGIVVLGACTPQETNHTDTSTSKSSELNSQPPVRTEYGIEVDHYTSETGVIKSGQTLSGVFEHVGVPRGIAARLNTLPDSIFNVKKVRAGNQFTVYRMQDSLKAPAYIVYHSSLVEHVVFNVNDTLAVSHFQKPVTAVEKVSSAVIETSLWDATIKNDLNLNLSLSYRTFMHG